MAAAKKRDYYIVALIMIAGFAIAFIGSPLLAVVHNYMSAIISLFLIGSGPNRV